MFVAFELFADDAAVTVVVLEDVAFGDVEPSVRLLMTAEPGRLKGWLSPLEAVWHLPPE